MYQAQISSYLTFKQPFTKCYFVMTKVFHKNIDIPYNRTLHIMYILTNVNHVVKTQ